MRIPFKGKYRTLNTVKISAQSLRLNLALYRELAPEKMVCPVLKANAYGHGLTEVAKALDPEKPEFFVVDSLHEAYQLKKAGIKSKILILGYTFPENLLRKKLPFHFAVSDLGTAKALSKYKAKVHLKIDTGMNRMGFSVENLPQVLEKFKELKVEVVGVLSHLADADNAHDVSYTKQQFKKFEEAVQMVRTAGFEPEYVHIEQSAGALYEGGFNMVRLGLGLYGVSPFADNDMRAQDLEKLQPVMQLESTLAGIRDLVKGDRVSYSCTFAASRDMKIGMVPVGYYEALPWSLSNKGVLEVKGVLCPIVGRVCMNYTMVDLTGVEDPEIGDKVVVYAAESGAKNSIANMAKLAGCIPYELLTRVIQGMRREVVK
ncbi:alanine racemase [Candidatus Peregrinibacteria bacterium]|jgi:alanine racemase|nr:alanine racemase [Candidatus Peregrinibacteria bacterium]MBT7702612.1 alanine racemase [Candidatus Peregrinibacteria bacterium]